MLCTSHHNLPLWHLFLRLIIVCHPPRYAVPFCALVYSVLFKAWLSAVLLNLQYLQAAHTCTDTHTRANTFWHSFCLFLLSLCLSFSCSLSHTQMQTNTCICTEMQWHVDLGSYRHSYTCTIQSDAYTTIPSHMAHGVQTKNLHEILAGVLWEKAEAVMWGKFVLVIGKKERWLE